jgi:hypothetical protein
MEALFDMEAKRIIIDCAESYQRYRMHHLTRHGLLVPEDMKYSTTCIARLQSNF